MLCNMQGHSHADIERHKILIVELKTCQDTRPTDQMTAARQQHEELVERLVERGYQRDNIKIYPILLGGTIYAAHTIGTLEQLGVQRDAALSCAQKLHTLMVQQLHSGPGLLTAKSFKHGPRGPAGLQDLVSLQDCNVNSRDPF
ncbi:hypothetical protein FOA52_015519 [Chlamydomonas sp. UWO 241]|nr:hypothetical protein FOA52_015519 [Chlamydomonas sp. UWO 241]